MAAGGAGEGGRGEGVGTHWAPSTPVGWGGVGGGCRWWGGPGAQWVPSPVPPPPVDPSIII